MVKHPLITKAEPIDMMTPVISLGRSAQSPLPESCLHSLNSYKMSGREPGRSNRRLTLATNSVPPMRQYGLVKEMSVVNPVTCRLALTHAITSFAGCTHEQYLYDRMSADPHALPDMLCP